MANAATLDFEAELNRIRDEYLAGRLSGKLLAERIAALWRSYERAGPFNEVAAASESDPGEAVPTTKKAAG